MEGRKKEFLEGPFSEGYGYPATLSTPFDDFIATEFSRLKEGNTTYLDYAGAGLYTKTQIERCMARLLDKQCFANPHSLGNAGDGLKQSLAVSTSNEIRAARIQVAEFFNTTLATHSVVFTSGCTAALKLVGECFNWSVSPSAHPAEKSTLALLHPQHNSATGVREYAAEVGATYLSTHDDVAFISEAERTVRANPHVPHLLVLPAQCNFSGVRYDLGVIAKLKEMQQRVLEEVLGSADAAAEVLRTAGWKVLLDASAYVPYAPLDLTAVPADYAALSFYKMFGYPTGLGALVLRNDAAAVLSRKRYFGGGTLSAAIQDTPYHVLRDTISERFEDGTVSFAEIPLLKYGFEALERVGGMAAINAHTHALTRYLASRLLSLRHASGEPLCVLSGNHAQSLSQADGKCAPEYSSTQGPIVTFSMKHADGSWVAPSTVATLAALFGIQIRTGCACNPCACQQFLGISDEEALANARAGKVCWAGDMDIVNGKATGAIRASLGYSSRFEDVDAFVSFIEEHFLEGEVQKPSKETSTGEQNHSLKVSNIILFPVKGCSGFETDSWEVTSKGSLIYDREWAIIGPDNRILIQKAVPTLCFVKPSIDPKRKILRLEAKGMEPLELKIIDDEEVCDCEGDVAMCGMRRGTAQEPEENVKAASEWFTKFLGYKCTWTRAKKNANFMNAADFLMLSQASFDDLMVRIPEEYKDGIDLINFRPNVIIDGATPFQEDTWKTIQIGPHIFSGVRLCDRCATTCVDRRTATFTPEPLKTLAKYRNIDKGIMFGHLMNWNASSSGRPWIVSKGMRIIVLETK